MRRLTRWAAVLAAALAAVLAARDADARPHAKVEWASVDGPNREDGARIQKLLKLALAKAAKKANFGDAKAVKLTARVVEMTTDEHGDVVRINCTVMGRVVGGKGARSRISYGGSPDKRAELEQQVLTQVAQGLVARLAQIVRTSATHAQK